jgi:hypothetical protein
MQYSTESSAERANVCADILKFVPDIILHNCKSGVHFHTWGQLNYQPSQLHYIYSISISRLYVC